MTRDDFRAALANPNVRAFLRVLRAGESSQNDSAYSYLFGGGYFGSFNDHPRKTVTASLGANTISSTAAGAYQFLSKTWDGLVALYGFTDFSPQSQDEAAVALIYGRNALNPLLNGDLDYTIALTCREWASLPGSPYGQPRMSLDRARQVYQEYGGTFGPILSQGQPVAVPGEPSLEPAPAPAPP